MKKNLLSIFSYTRLIINRSIAPSLHIVRKKHAFVCMGGTASVAVTNVQIEGEFLEQAVLPVRMGGLGIRLYKDIALRSFISSHQSVSSHLVKIYFWQRATIEVTEDFGRQLKLNMR